MKKFSKRFKAGLSLILVCGMVLGNVVSANAEDTLTTDTKLAENFQQQVEVAKDALDNAEFSETVAGVVAVPEAIATINGSIVSDEVLAVINDAQAEKNIKDADKIVDDAEKDVDEKLDTVDEKVNAATAAAVVAGEKAELASQAAVSAAAANADAQAAGNSKDAQKAADEAKDAADVASQAAVEAESAKEEALKNYDEALTAYEEAVAEAKAAEEEAVKKVQAGAEDAAEAVKFAEDAAKRAAGFKLAMDKAYEAASKYVDDKEAELAQARKELAEATEKLVAAAVNELAKFKDTVKTGLTLVAADAVLELAKGVDKLAEINVENKEAAIKALEDKKAAAEKAIADAETELKKLKADASADKKAVEEAEKALETIKKTLETANKTLETEKGIMEKAQADYDTKNAELAALLEKVETEGYDKTVYDLEQAIKNATTDEEVKSLTEQLVAVVITNKLNASEVTRDGKYFVVDGKYYDYETVNGEIKVYEYTHQTFEAGYTESSTDETALKNKFAGVDYTITKQTTEATYKVSGSGTSKNKRTSGYTPVEALNGVTVSYRVTHLWIEYDARYQNGEWQWKDWFGNWHTCDHKNDEIITKYSVNGTMTETQYNNLKNKLDVSGTVEKAATTTYTIKLNEAADLSVKASDDAKTSQDNISKKIDNKRTDVSNASKAAVAAIISYNAAVAAKSAAAASKNAADADLKKANDDLEAANKKVEDKQKELDKMEKEYNDYYNNGIRVPVPHFGIITIIPSSYEIDHAKAELELIDAKKDKWLAEQAVKVAELAQKAAAKNHHDAVEELKKATKELIDAALNEGAAFIKVGVKKYELDQAKAAKAAAKIAKDYADTLSKTADKALADAKTAQEEVDKLLATTGGIKTEELTKAEENLEIASKAAVQAQLDAENANKAAKEAEEDYNEAVAKVAELVAAEEAAKDNGNGNGYVYVPSVVSNTDDTLTIPDEETAQSPANTGDVDTNATLTIDGTEETPQGAVPNTAPSMVLDDDGTAQGALAQTGTVPVVVFYFAAVALLLAAIYFKKSFAKEN